MNVKFQHRPIHPASMHELILYLSFAGAVAASLFSLRNLETGTALNVTILAFTALAIVWTTIDAKNNALEAQRANLRPVILRDGIISNWLAFKAATEREETNTNFLVANNIATNVTGYVVVGNKKYILSFAISKPGALPNQFISQISRDSSVTWILPNRPIAGSTYPDRFSISTEPEGFYIFYSDISGNKYKTFEDSQLVVVSEKLTF